MSNRVASFVLLLRSLGSFEGPSLPGYRSNKDINRPISRKDIDPSLMPFYIKPKPRYRRIRFILLFTFRPSSLYRRPFPLGSATRLDWTVLSRLHFRLVFVIFIHYNLNHIVYELRSNGRRIRPTFYCPYNQPPICFAVAALAIGPI